METIKKNWKAVLILIVAVVALFVVLFRLDQNPSENAGMPEANQQSPSTAPAPLKSGTADKTQTYTQLVAQYKDRRIQFDAGCQAIPNNITYKNGTKIMLDNRSGDARTITVGGVQHQLSGYGYKIITLSSQTLPKTFLLSCGSAVNVGQILLQK